MNSNQPADRNNFQRLLDEQSSCIESTQQQISQLEKFKQDYESVIETVQDLEKSLSKPAYLPFGRKAFVPGRLVHTNELLVFLGGHGDYFAKMSASETVQLLNRRIKNLNLKIDGLAQQKKLLEDRLPYTKELTSVKPLSSTNTDKNTGLDGSEEFEIREDYNSDEELQWKKKHTLSRQRERIENTKLESPVLKSDRKVSFDLSSIKSSQDYSSDSTSSTTDSCSDLYTIRFKHSLVRSPIPRAQIDDMSTMTVAEAIDLVRKSGSIGSTCPLTRPDPFGTIVERNVASSTPTEPCLLKTDRISRFRAQRQAEKRS